MGVLRFKYIFFGSFLGFNGASQAVITFLLIPCCLAMDLRAPPLIPNVPFLLAWNAPTEICSQRFNVLLDLSLFNFIGSPRKGFPKQDVAIFYADRLGYYPHIHEVTGKLENGAIPQLGSLDSHLHKAANDIDQTVPTDQLGLAVIDWENWRPLWERNWKPKDIYKNMSIDLALRENPLLNQAEATKIAKKEFEKAGRRYMYDTLKLGKSMRPNYLWGFYLFPDCYNHHYAKPGYDGICPDIEKKRNDELDWLWKESTALFPSIYLNRQLQSTPQAVLFARYRVEEAIRISKVPNPKSPLPIFVYIRPVLTDVSSAYLTQQACMNLDYFLKTLLNPYLINVTLAAKMCSQVLCQEQGVCVRKHLKSNDYLHLNPANFEIQIGQGGKYIVQGKPTLEDLQQFSEKFYCSCFTGSVYKKKNDIKNVSVVSVCMAANVCIEASVDSATRGHGPPSCNMSLTTTRATKFPCGPRMDFSVHLEGTCSARTSSAPEGGGKAKWKNTFMIYIIQVQLQFLLNYLLPYFYVLISFKIFYLRSYFFNRMTIPTYLTFYI
ncbi:hyaluronidase PH-20-like isoform X2 [Tamandua tetradactyla]|uniref:hyaluronidase PH-20-like isoform X2 n=1 Tax=Tamandua tetradactyla TaxID=48850 RepID=UPI004053C574